MSFLCLALVMAGCAGNQAQESNGLVGWWEDAVASACLCPAKASECQANDCALTNVREFNSDGSYLQGTVMMSPGHQTATVVEMFHGHYEALGDTMRFTPDGAHAFVVTVSLDGDRLIVSNLVQTRAPSWLASSLANAATTVRSR
jgi:hypothetical protein